MQNSDDRRRVLMENNLQANFETKRNIKAALIALLKQEKYENIRMTDIIRKSGVSRMGVYNNYKSKEEILLDLYKAPIEEAFSNANTSLIFNLEWIFKKAYQYKNEIRTLIDAGLAPTLLDMINKRYDTIPNPFFARIWNGLLYNSVIEWIKSDTDEPVESAIERMKADLLLTADAIKKGKILPPPEG